MVVTAQALASNIGADILRRGGNAIDAAVAVGYAEAVVNPCCGNIGGGGFMVIHLAKTGRDVFVNFRETAPAGGERDHVSRRRRQADSRRKPRRLWRRRDAGHACSASIRRCANMAQ